MLNYRIENLRRQVAHSGAALATVVGVLIEVPVMLLVVRVVNATRGWYETDDSKVSRASIDPPEFGLLYERAFAWQYQHYDGRDSAGRDSQSHRCRQDI